MKIGIIGTGYVGLPTGVGLAELGNTVVCVDKIKEKVDDLKQGKLTIYEDGLEDLFKKNIQAGRLTFTTNMKKAIEGADVVLIAVGTPPHPRYCFPRSLPSPFPGCPPKHSQPSE